MFLASLSLAVKGVNFYGPKSEYIISGSDCSNIFIWEKQTEKVVQYFHGDDGGVVSLLCYIHCFFVVFQSKEPKSPEVFMFVSKKTPKLIVFVVLVNKRNNEYNLDL